MKPPAEGSNRAGTPGSRPNSRPNPVLPPLALPDAEALAPPGGLIGEWRATRALDRLVGALAALILFAMMALTFVNVFMRYFLRQPISGAFEIMTYLMAIMLFVALVLVAGRSEHVRVGLLDSFVPGWLRQIRMIAFNLVMAGVCAVLGWRLWLFGNRLARWDEATQMYGLPLDALAWLMAICCHACAVLFVLTALRCAVRRDFAIRAET